MRWLGFSVLQPYGAHLYDILSTDDVNFISHSIMIEKKINLSLMFVTCLPPRYSPHIDTNGKNHVALPLARLDLSVSKQLV